MFTCTGCKRTQATYSADCCDTQIEWYATFATSPAYVTPQDKPDTFAPDAVTVLPTSWVGFDSWGKGLMPLINARCTSDYKEYAGWFHTVGHIVA